MSSRKSSWTLPKGTPPWFGLKGKCLNCRPNRRDGAGNAWPFHCQKCKLHGVQLGTNFDNNGKPDLPLVKPDAKVSEADVTVKSSSVQISKGQEKVLKCLNCRPNRKDSAGATWPFVCK